MPSTQPFRPFRPSNAWTRPTPTREMICFPQSANLNGHFTKKHPRRHTQNHVFARCLGVPWPISGHIKLTSAELTNNFLCLGEGSAVLHLRFPAARCVGTCPASSHVTKRSICATPSSCMHLALPLRSVLGTGRSLGSASL